MCVADSTHQMTVAVTADTSHSPIPADADSSTDGISVRMAAYKLKEHDRYRNLKILGTGAVAGTLSGLIGTVSGQGGPPLIVMYAILEVPKVTTALFALAPAPTPCLPNHNCNCESQAMPRLRVQSMSKCACEAAIIKTALDYAVGVHHSQAMSMPNLCNAGRVYVGELCV